MNQEYLRELYKNYKLFPRKAYYECNLAELEREILCEVGLPKIEFFLEFYTQKDNPVYLAQFHESYNIEGFMDWVVIGESEYETPLCINHKGEIVIFDGCVYDNDDESGICFVNNSLGQLLECIAVYLKYGNKINEKEARITKLLYKPDQVDELFEELDKIRRIYTNNIREEFQKIDARALEQEENWWQFVLEELESGVI